MKDQEGVADLCPQQALFDLKFQRWLFHLSEQVLAAAPPGFFRSEEPSLFLF
jgi:hypothetical protein